MSISRKSGRLHTLLVRFAHRPAAALARASRSRGTSGAARFAAALLVAFAFGLLPVASPAFAETGLFDAPSAIDISATPAPTIQSDQTDYPPNATVHLSGTDWLAEETVKIVVKDDEGQSWSLTDYVSADAEGNVDYSFNLPNWFVARYSVVATGIVSGLTATTSFTDANFASLQGQSKGSTTWVAGNLSGWEELDPIPMRVLIDPASADVNNVSTVTIEYDHTKTKGGSVYQGLDRPLGFAVAGGDASKIQCLNCDNPVRSEPTGSDTWSVSLQVKPLVAAASSITFRTRLRAGAHYFTGSSLALSGNANPGGGLGILQVPKPAPKSGSPDLQLTKIGPSTAAPGSTITYTLNYSNNSTATGSATGIQLTDTLPSGVTYASGCVAPTCSVSVDGRTLVWDLVDLAPGASGSVSFTAMISSDLAYGTTVTNNAEMNSAENDAAFTDNRGSASTEVRFNRAPSATAQSVSTDEGTAKTITLSGTDPDGNGLGYKITSLPANGSLYDGTSVFVTRITSLGTSGYVLSSNQVTYLPDSDYNGSDSFAFKANDGSLDSPSATVSLTITPVNDAPSATATPESPSLPEDGQTTVTLAGSDAETAAADLEFKITALPAHGTLSKDGTTLALGESFTGSPADVVYAPDSDYNGSDSFAFKANDGSLDSPSATVSLTITPVNDAPSATATPESPSLPEDGQTTVTLAGSDAETAAADLEFKITALPAHGTLSKDGTTLALGESFTGSPADVVYAPDPDYNGPDQFKFELSDRGDPDNCGTPTAGCVAVKSDERTVELTVTPVNDAPSGGDSTTGGDAPSGGDPTNGGDPTSGGTVPGTIASSPQAPASQPAPQGGITRPTSRRIEVVPIDQIAKLPQCSSRRRFRIRLRTPHGDRLVKANVFVNGRQVKVVRGKRLTSPVDLRGLPKGRFTVKILVTTASGRRLVGTRRYRTCTPRPTVSKQKRPPTL